jgi:hypothetical protein
VRRTAERTRGGGRGEKEREEGEEKKGDGGEEEMIRRAFSTHLERLC